MQKEREGVRTRTSKGLSPANAKKITRIIENADTELLELEQRAHLFDPEVQENINALREYLEITKEAPEHKIIRATRSAIVMTGIKNLKKKLGEK